MKKSNTQKNIEDLKKQADTIATSIGLYKSNYNPSNHSCNYKDPYLPLLITFYPTKLTIGISFDKRPMKWYKKCSVEQMKKILNDPIKYADAT